MPDEAVNAEWQPKVLKGSPLNPWCSILLSPEQRETPQEANKADEAVALKAYGCCAWLHVHPLHLLKHHFARHKSQTSFAKYIEIQSHPKIFRFGVHPSRRNETLLCLRIKGRGSRVAFEHLALIVPDVACLPWELLSVTQLDVSQPSRPIPSTPPFLLGRRWLFRLQCDHFGRSQSNDRDKFNQEVHQLSDT